MAKKPKAPTEKPKDPPAVPAKLLSGAFAGLQTMRDTLAAASETESQKPQKQAFSKPKPPPKLDAAPVVETWQPDRDVELFRAAMSGVAPLGERSVPRVPPPRGDGHGSRHATGFRRAQAEGGDPLPVQWNAEHHCQAARPGRSFALEALRQFATVDETLDLHRAELSEVRHRVAEFVRTRRARGLRVVCVVHGRGRHAPDGVSVLRDAVVSALAEAPACRELDAFCTASPDHGGHGAILVALRGK